MKRTVHVQVRMTNIRQVEIEIDDNLAQDVFQMAENEALRQFGRCDEIEILKVEPSA